MRSKNTWAALGLVLALLAVGCVIRTEHKIEAHVTVDIRQTPGILHLKSGVTALGEHRLLALDALA